MSSKLKIAGTCLLSAALLAFVSPPLSAKGPEGGRGGGASAGRMGGGGAGGGAVRVPSGGSSAGHTGGSAAASGAIRGSSSPAAVQSSAGGRAATPGATVSPGVTQRSGQINGRTFSGSSGGWGRHHGPGFDDWWWFGFGFPWFTFGSWWPGYYGYYYPYGYPYYGGNVYNYYYDSGVDPYAGAYTPGGAMTPTAPEAANATGDFYAQALAAFKQGDFSAAVGLARHAAIDNPRDPNVHLLLMLAASASGDHRGAAMEAHAVAALGPVPDWPTLFGLFGNLPTYTEQRSVLEKFVASNPSAPEGHFVLGLQYMMEGHRDAAQGELLKSLKLAPQDRLAAQLLEQAGGTVPPEIARQLPGKGSEPGKMDVPGLPSPPSGSSPGSPPPPPRAPSAPPAQPKPATGASGPY